MDNYTKWETPFSTERFVFFDSIIDQEKLLLKLSSGDSKYLVEFESYVYFKVVLEEYTTHVSSSLKGRQHELGPARMIEDSSLVLDLTKEPIVEIGYEKGALKHFEIAGGDKVIQIVSGILPHIEQL